MSRGISNAKLVEYLDSVLDSMLKIPSCWGALGCVENQVLRILEVRLLVTQGGTFEDTNNVMTTYLKFLKEEFPKTRGRGLSVCVDDDVAEFADALKKFCGIVRAEQDETTGTSHTSHRRSSVGTAIRELLDARDFLALQLEEASGAISKEEFEERAAPFFERLRECRDVEEARSIAHDLFEVADLDVDAEELSVMLRCTVATANTLVTEGQDDVEN